jgi:WD40 repeat protein
MPEPNVPSGSVENATGEPPAIPGHRLLRRIGRGSYGEVWLAQSAQGEYRAVKFVYRATFERERPFEREFSGIQKFEPVSRAHPSQVSILQVGRDDEAGFFYYVMELADDQQGGRAIDPQNYKPRTLRSEVAAAGRIPFDRALDISLGLTKALEHLHQHDLIHRDIKPSNIIFVAGVPKLADIGLVTDVGASISYVGTEGFLPPEGPVSQQADLYSLGKVLYEMSTGQDRMDFPELPTFLGDAGERNGLLELNLVFLKACQNDPQKRYRTAREMSADLAILRSGKSLKRARALERRLVNVTRAFAVTAAVGLLIAAGYYAWNRHRIGQLKAEVIARNRDRQTAQQAARDQTRKLVNAYLATGERVAQQGDLGGALAWFAGALKEETEPALAAGHETRMRKAVEAFPKLVGFIAHGGGIGSARFSRDARRATTAGEDSTVKIWDIATAQLIGKPLRHKSPVRYAEMSPDNERVLTICKDGTAWLWRVSADDSYGGSPTAFQIEHGAPVLAAEFSPDGRFALTRADSKQVIVWDGLSARARFKFEDDEVPAHAKYSPDGRCVGVAAGNKLTFWDTERGTKIAQATAKDRKFSRFAFSPDSRRVVALAGNVAQLCNVADGEWSVFSLGESSSTTAAEFVPDGRVIITASENGSIRSWDAITGSAVGQPWHFGAGPGALAMSPDASAIGFASEHRLSLVDLRSYRRIMPSSPHRHAICSSELSADARLVLTADFDGAVWLTEVFSGSTNTPQEPALSREDLVASARLLSGRELNDDEQLVDVKTERLLADWRRLRTNVTFAATPPTQWHAARAERLFSDALWFGVRFHVERLGKLGAVDTRVREWEAKAAAELARSERREQPAPIVPRSPGAPANLIDLGEFYNASLTAAWLPTNYAGQGNDLSQLPVGLQKFNGVPFDVRGVVQLSGSALENLGGKFPKQVTGIVIERAATNLHFLQGAVWDALYGTVIGKYVIHYANGEKREAKIVFGKNVRDWWFPPTQPQTTMEAAVAWQGYNSASRDVGMALRIYQYRWKNPLPDEKIARIDFVSALEKPAPFLLALTTEPVD